MLIWVLFPSFLNSNGIDLNRFLIELRRFDKECEINTSQGTHTKGDIFALETPNLSGLEGLYTWAFGMQHEVWLLHTT